MKSTDIIERLNHIPSDESDLVAPIYEALDGVEEIDDPEKFFPLAFKYMRERSSADFGMPGPLSSLIEDYFPRYIGDLAESLKVMPTEPTLFLAGRILNSARLKRDQISIQALPTLITALQSAKDNLTLEPWLTDEIDKMINEANNLLNN